MKQLSCGILIVNPQHELLLAHATGTRVWDIPKGGGEAGESPRRTAIRETAEETGLVFGGDELLDLGRFAYRPAKDLHLFAALIARDAAQELHCRSHFVDWLGRRQPEMDAFAWTPFDRVAQRCARRLAALLTRTLSLPQLLLRLQQRERGTAARGGG